MAYSDMNPYIGANDGVFGPLTKKAWQVFLKNAGFYSGLIDGNFGGMSWTAVQKWLKAKGTYTRAVDGAPGYYTYRALWNLLKSKPGGYLYGESFNGKFSYGLVRGLQVYLRDCAQANKQL